MALIFAAVGCAKPFPEARSTGRDWGDEWTRTVLIFFCAGGVLSASCARATWINPVSKQTVQTRCLFILFQSIKHQEIPIRISLPFPSDFDVPHSFVQLPLRSPCPRGPAAAALLDPVAPFRIRSSRCSGSRIGCIPAD